MAIIRISREVLEQLLDLPDGVQVRNLDLDVRTLDALIAVGGENVPDGQLRPVYADHGMSGLSMDPASRGALTDG